MRQRRIPVSEAGELAAAQSTTDTRAVQLEWRTHGELVELLVRNLPDSFIEELVKGLEPTLDKNDAIVLRLSFPRAAAAVAGVDAGSEHTALKLQAATLALNRTLRELWS